MNRKLLLLVAVSAPVLVLDQITKALITRSLGLHESVVVIEGFFSLTYIRNPGAAFGVFADRTDGFRTLFFLAISIFAIGLLLYFLVKTSRRDRLSLIAISMLFGGALGNLVDRVRLGEVIDFFDFYVGSYHWPAFNVADSAITIGISLLIFDTFMKGQVQPDSKKVPMIEGG
jgi:signal peptidase II